MASVDGLSDGELLKKMKEYGINVPLIDSTRKIIIMSIKKKQSEEKKPTSSSSSSKRPSDRRSSALYSSGDDSGDDKNEHPKSKMLPPSSTQRKTRRQTIGVVSPPTDISIKSRRSEIAHNVPAISVPIPMSEPKKRLGRSSILAAQRQVAQISTDEYDAGSDSDVPLSKVLGSREPKTSSVDKTVGALQDATAKFSSRLSTIQNAFVLEQNKAIETNGSSVSSLLSYRKQSPSQPTSSETSKPKEDVSSPFLSDFARRLSRQSAHESRTYGTPTPRASELFRVKKSDVGDDYIAASTSHAPLNGHFLTTQASPSGARSRDISREFKTTEEATGFWTSSHVVSMVLLAVLFVFFAVIAVAYVNIAANEAVNLSSDNQRNVFPTCRPVDVESPDPCVPPESLLAATSLLKHVHPELKRRAVRAACGPRERDGSFASPVMSEKMVVDWLVDQYAQNPETTLEHLRHLKTLLLANPHWGVAVTNRAPPLDRADESRSLQDVRQLVGHGGLVAMDVALPLVCHARLAAATMAYLLAVGGVCLLVVYLLQRAVMWYLRRRAADKQQVYLLVAQAVDLLQAHHFNAVGASPGGASPGGAPQSTYLAINHVRDQLIQPHDRYKMAGAWAKAVQFVEETESRVRSEVQQVAGEECPVWRWLPASTLANTSAASSSAGSPGASPQASPNAQSTTSISLSGLDLNRARVWQGQAFVTAPGAQNGAPRSPTNCLKIRHVFDDIEYGNDWVQKVKDALLEKCGAGVNVWHMVVDKKSVDGCVYMKCATNDDAGIAYRALHGWWFDSKLVTVKYIRLERFHERFPESLGARTPLRPSNDLKLSLSDECWPGGATIEAN